MWKIVEQQTMGETCFRCCNLFGWYMWDFPSGKFRWHLLLHHMFQMFKMDPEVMAPMVDWTFLKTQIIVPYYSTYDMIAALVKKGCQRQGTKGSFACFNAFCGVTPQAQNRGTSPSSVITGPVITGPGGIKTGRSTNFIWEVHVYYSNNVFHHHSPWRKSSVVFLEVEMEKIHWLYSYSIYIYI